MYLRLISGKFGGRRLVAPPGRRTHPMSERARAAMFSSLSGELQGARVLDAFAGSGAVGLEAVSRGAESVDLVESDRVAQRIIDENIASLNCENKARLVRATVAAWVNSDNTGQYDFIFADPPYHNPQLSTVEKLLSCLKIGGTMILSHSGKGEAPSGVKGIVVVDNRSYGNACLTYFRREE